MKNSEDVRPLSEEEINEKLKEFPGWEYKENKISKQFKLRTFTDVTDLLSKLTPFCNELDHHPDVHIYYSKVTFELTRYDISGKVTQRDFTVAQKIEEFVKEYSG